MKDRKHFTHRIDMWDDDGENVIEYLAGVEDFEVAKATYRAACRRWPGAAIVAAGYAGHREQPADAACKGPLGTRDRDQTSDARFCH
jgi:hypothetical protein